MDILEHKSSIGIKIIDALNAFIGNLILRAKQNYYRKKLHVEKLDIHFPVFISSFENLKIGENCAINAFVHIWANETVTIGNNSMLAAHVQLATSTHDYNHRPYRDKRIDRPITIGNNVWVGGGAIILPGVTIGDNSVIGAGSVVTKDIPENSLAYGVPAKVVKVLANNSARNI